MFVSNDKGLYELNEAAADATLDDFCKVPAILKMEIQFNFDFAYL